MTTRRDFLRGAGVTAVAALPPALLSPGEPRRHRRTRWSGISDLRRAFRLRRDAARAYLDQAEPPERTNEDEERYDDRRASFSKTLPHNDLGEVKPEAYKDWLAILWRSASSAITAAPTTSSSTASP
jgi:hypothetical protein